MTRQRARDRIRHAAVPGPERPGAAAATPQNRYRNPASTDCPASGYPSVTRQLRSVRFSALTTGPARDQRAGPVTSMSDTQWE